MAPVQGLYVCGVDGCPHTEVYAHRLGQHKKYDHGIDGQSAQAIRNRNRAAQTNSAPPKPVRVVVAKPAELPPEWGAWKPEEVLLLRRLSAVWGEDLPATVDLLRSRLFADVARWPAVKRLARQEQVGAESRRREMRSV